jgi:hypothetical protein
MAHTILAHTIADNHLEEARGFRRRIGATLGGAASRGPFLPTLAALATDVAGTLLTVDAEPTEGVEWLRRSARASALFFGRVVLPDRVLPACALERLARSRGIVSGVVSAYAPELVFTA